MIARRIVGLFLALGIGSLAIFGCASGDDDVDSANGALTPCSTPGATGATCPRDTDDQREVCKSRVKENGAFRDKDIAAGVVRWKCGDVQGVNKIDLGQEYCEFHAMQDGVSVDTVAKSKVNKSSPVECLFTGVYGDVKGSPGSKGNLDFGAKLNKALTEEAGNLKNAKGKQLAMMPAKQPDDSVKAGPNPFSLMNGQFNNRFAASTLIKDCQKATTEDGNADRVNKADDSCKSDGTGCVSARDVEACTLIVGHGEGWRNSDPIICERSARGALCGAKYKDIPKTLDGFLMTDWKGDVAQAVQVAVGKSTKAPSAPDGCRYATVDGKPYMHMMICTPTPAQVSNPKFEGRLQQMCSDTFGPSIAMTAPIGLVADLSSDNDGFCGDFNKGAKALVGVATGK